MIFNRMDPQKMLIWHVNPYGEHDPLKDISANNDPYSVLRKSSPWPQRNAKCFQSLNILIERFDGLFSSYLFNRNDVDLDVMIFKNYDQQLNNLMNYRRQHVLVEH